MSNRSFYQETFSQVHSSVHLRWEDFAQPRKRRPARRLWLLAAGIVLLAALSAGAVAAHLLGLRDLVLPQEQPASSPRQAAQWATLSLSGYLYTPESQALAEWNDFLTTYDPDGAILSVVGNYPEPALDKYHCYLVYTQDMADKLEEIAAKYGLILHIWEHVVETQDDWIALLGDFLGDSTAYSGMIAEDGTFHYDGYLIPDSGTRLDYQFRRSVKGSLNDAYFTVDDLSVYEEWYYKTDEGWDLTLDLGPGRGFLLADLGDCFIFVTVLGGANQGVTKQDMKNLADSFDFSLLTPAHPLDEAFRAPEPQQSVPSGPKLPDGIAGVLAEDGALYDTTGGVTTTLSRFLDVNAPEGYRLAADSYAVVDLEQDGTLEAVLLLTLDAGTDYGHLVLRQGSDGTVYGYALGSRELMDLKADGTYSYSYGAGSNGFGQMLFSETDASGTVCHDWATAPISYMDTVTDAHGTTHTDYYWNEQPICQGVYEDALAAQQSKEDASWHSMQEIQAP